MTNGVFAVGRNPIYVAFWFALLAQFLLFSKLIPLVYLAATTWLFHRQVYAKRISCGGITVSSIQTTAAG